MRTSVTRETLLLVVVLLLAIAGCGTDASDEPEVTVTKDDTAGDVAADDTGPDDASADDGSADDGSADEPTDAASADATPEPTEEIEPTAEPTAEPTPTGPPTENLPGGRYVKIDAVRADGQSYAVDFTPYNFQPLIGSGPEDFHIHFFWNTLEPENAGTNGPNPGAWALYDGPSPFTEYGFADRPPAATQMCALVADAAHGVTLESGNCVTLP